MALDYPLFNDEELVLLCKDGNSDALSCLAQRYMKTADFIASRFHGCPIENADLIQEAMFAFLSAVYSYDQSKGSAFETYASTCMRNRIISLIRTLSSKKRVPPGMVIPFDESDDIPVTPSPEENIINEDSAEYISSVISSSLSKKEAEVFKLHLLGLSYEEIAKQLDSPVKSVDSALQRARKKLRDKLRFYK